MKTQIKGDGAIEPESIGLWTRSPSAKQWADSL